MEKLKSSLETSTFEAKNKAAGAVWPTLGTEKSTRGLGIKSLYTNIFWDAPPPRIPVTNEGF